MIVLIFAGVVYDKTRFYLSNLEIYTHFNRVLEKAYIVENDGEVIQTRSFKPHKTAELSIFREEIASFETERITIQYSSQYENEDKVLRLYLKNIAGSLLSNVLTDDITFQFNDTKINDIQIFHEPNSELKIKVINPQYFAMNLNEVSNTVIPGKYMLVIPTRDGRELVIEFDYNEYKGITFMGGLEPPETIIEKFVFNWILGLKYDQEKINQNLSF